MEKICLKLLNSDLELNNILCDEQYGFRPKRSTSLAIFNYIKTITENINKKKIVGSIYLDFAKAFDSINHQILIMKLQDMGGPFNLVHLIENYLGNRKIRTKLNNLTSTTKNLLWCSPGINLRTDIVFMLY